MSQICLVGDFLQDKGTDTDTDTQSPDSIY
ncbi:hypothetical protein V6Z11_D01G121300 [Gossypium hirsutum]